MSVTVISTNVQGSSDSGTSFAKRTVNHGGGYSAARFLFSASDFPTSAKSLIFTLSCNEDTNDAFCPSLWVGSSSPSKWSEVASSCWKFATLSSTKGNASWSGELTCVVSDPTTVSEFLTKIKSQLYVYIHGSSISRQSVCVDCLSLSIEIEDGAATYVWGSKTTGYSYPAAAMTSNSSQSCVASASTENTSHYRAYRAFDGSTTNAWASSSSDTAPYIQLQMPQALCNLSFTITNRGDRDNHINGPLTGIFYGSNDGSSWTQIGTFTRSDGETKGGGTSTHTCNNTTAYKYARVSILTWADDGSKFVCIGELSISGTITTTGWQSAIPYVWTTDRTEYIYPEAAMTSANSQGCIASASSYYDEDDYPAWRAFDYSTSTNTWASARGVSEAWLMLKMPRKLYGVAVTICNRSDHATLVNGPTSGIIQGSNDGIDFYNLATFSGRDGATKGAYEEYYCNETNNGFSYIRIYVTEWDRTTASSKQTECCIGDCHIRGFDLPMSGGWKSASSKVF